MAEKRTRRYVTGFCLLFLLLALMLAANLMVGSVMIPPERLLQLLADRTKDNASPEWEILWNIRMPRFAGAAVLGGGLASAGFLLQTFFSNPIAGPYVLGISTGAKMTVAAAMVLALRYGFILSSAHMVAAAFAGSLLTMTVILLFSRRVRSLPMLIVCGVMIGYICSSVTELIIAFADDANIVNLHSWSMGTFSGLGWDQVRAAAVITGAAELFAFLLAKPMGAYQMGEVYAANMGVNVRLFRMELILLSSLLAACVAAFAGPVSFVGIAVPHLSKKLFRTAKPLIMLPACFLSGSVFCLFCDLLSRTLFAPSELSISTITAVFGAPVVVGMLLERREKEHV